MFRHRTAGLGPHSAHRDRPPTLLLNCSSQLRQPARGRWLQASIKLSGRKAAREYVREMKDSQSLGIQGKQSAMSPRVYLYPQPNLPRALEKSSHAQHPHAPARTKDRNRSGLTEVITSHKSLAHRRLKSHAEEVSFLFQRDC